VTPSVAVVVSTYNWSDALAAVLAALVDQTYDRFEVVVADDGSGAETREVVESFAASGRVPIKHVWHEDTGWRLAAIRNRAIAAVESDYVVFLDGDCIVRPRFVERHARLAERGWYVRGARVRLSQEMTSRTLSSNARIHRWNMLQWLGCCASGGVNRWLPLMSLPMGPLRKQDPLSWRKVTGHNFAVWRDDLMAVNGFDERFEGWGSEEVDLVVRLVRAGIRRKEGRLAVTVVHLWHEEASRESVNRNAAILDETLQSERTRAERGVEQYLTRSGPSK
jgi:glycosyltransferase involved in cell wall biosynthesis